MSTKLLFLSAGVVAALLTACATPSNESGAAADQSLRKMTSKRLQTVLDGNSVEWEDGSVVYYRGAEIKAFDPDGTTVNGAVSFKNDLHCSRWNGGDERCSTVYEGADGELSFFVPGEADSLGAYARVLKGNPRKL